MKAVLIGAGNAAFHIAPTLQKAGLEWVQVYNRTLSKAHELARRLKDTVAVNDWADITPDAELYVFAVCDEFLPEAASRLHIPGKTAVHVAGAMPLSVLQTHWTHCGVMYFFQTFSRLAPSPDFAQIPICLEASDSSVSSILENIAKKISDKVCFLSFEQRKALHLSGVFANNYVNLMYRAAYDLLKEKEVDFSLLLPLIRQTAQKVERYSPHQIQTGPAIRGDEAVLQQHIEYLSHSPQGQSYLEIYRLLASKIQAKNGNKNH